MGRNNPTTPGSSRPGEERIWMVPGTSIGVLERTAARNMAPASRTQHNQRPMNRHAQKPKIVRAAQSRGWAWRGPARRRRKMVD